MSRAPISLPSPVAGTLHEFGWPRPPGNHDFRVTKTAAQHDVKGAKALDLGDGDPDRDNALSMLAGTVILRRPSDGVLIIESFDKVWQQVYAHLAIDGEYNAHPQGSTVQSGQVIGHVSNTYPVPGVVASHLHLQVGYKVVNNVGWQDPWPLFAFNQFAVLNGAGINLRERAGTDAPIWATSRPDGIYRLGKLIAPLAARMDVQQPPFAAASGLVWVNALLNGKAVAIAKNLVHFDL